MDKYNCPDHENNYLAVHCYKCSFGILEQRNTLVSFLKKILTLLNKNDPQIVIRQNEKNFLLNSEIAKVLKQIGEK